MWNGYKSAPGGYLARTLSPPPEDQPPSFEPPRPPGGDLGPVPPADRRHPEPQEDEAPPPELDSGWQPPVDRPAQAPTPSGGPPAGRFTRWEKDMGTGKLTLIIAAIGFVIFLGISAIPEPDDDSLDSQATCEEWRDAGNGDQRDWVDDSDVPDLAHDAFRLYLDERCEPRENDERRLTLLEEQYLDRRSKDGIGLPS